MRAFRRIQRWFADVGDWHHNEKIRIDLRAFGLSISFLFFLNLKMLLVMNHVLAPALFFITVCLATSSIGQKYGILFFAWGYVISGALLVCFFLIFSLYNLGFLVYAIIVSGVIFGLFRGLTRAR